MLYMAGSREKWNGSRFEGSLVTHRSIRDALLLHYGIALQNSLPSLMVVPETSDSYELDPTICDNPYWLYAIKERMSPGDLDEHYARHQFTMYGGYVTDKRPATVTFLQRFLTASMNFT